MTQNEFGGACIWRAGIIFQYPAGVVNHLDKSANAGTKKLCRTWRGQISPTAIEY
jgi:hypothetical protein